MSILTGRTAVPLEANPDTFNSLARELGLDTDKLCFHDVLGFDDELLALIPHTIRAVVLLYPGTKQSMYRKQKVSGSVDRASLVHIWQRVHNQCGTMAMLHTLGNTSDVPLNDGFLKNLFYHCRGLPMDKAADKLDELDISKYHDAAALRGQSTTPPSNVHPEGAFSAFIEQNGLLIELDGWNEQPLLHGPIGQDLIHSVIDVVQNDIVPLEENIKFSLLALAPAE